MSGSRSISEPALDRLFDDARVVAARIGADVALDFADVLVRVHARAPELVPADAVRDVALTERVVDIHSATRGTPHAEAALDDLFADTREAIVRKVDARRMTAIAPLRRPTRGRRAAVIAVATSLAAAIAIAFASIDVVEEATPAPAHEPVDQALMGGHEGPGDRGFERHDTDREPQDVERAVEQATPSPQSELAPVQPPPAADGGRTAKRPLTPDRSEQLRTLSNEAQALWRGGDVRGAEKLLERIVAIGGKSVQVELAFADLFAIAHQLHGASARNARWTAYVRRFPRGRFADDARAGLCRGATETELVDCWRAYLRDFPSGSYRAEATRVAESK